jgi:hypothetical protein
MEKEIISRRYGDDPGIIDDSGDFDYPIYYDLNGGTLRFDIEIDTRYDIDFEMSQKENHLVRLYEVKLDPIVNLPPDSDQDMYVTDIFRKPGMWINIGSPTKHRKKRKKTHESEDIWKI